MHFEGRDLKQYAEPITAVDLNEGSIYFSVTFFDDEMLTPNIETLVFVGKKLGDAGADIFLFQDIDSYRQGVRIGLANVDDTATFFECSVEELNSVFEFEKALEVLMQCSLRRRKLK